MPKKLTYEEVKAVFEANGNELISTEYINSDTPLEYICDCGRPDKKRFTKYKQGSRCKKCAEEKRKLTFEQVKNIFESKGNELISAEYINSDAPLDYICDCGKPDKKSLYNFKNGQRCNDCGIKKRSASRKISYKEVREVFENKGNELISKEYIDSKTPLEYICDCGKLDKKRLNDFKRGQRCKECGIKKYSKKLKGREGTKKPIWDLEKMNTIASSKGYKIIDKKYEKKDYQNALFALIQCGNFKHKPKWVVWNSFKKGHECKECSYEKTGKQLWNKKDVEEFYLKHGLEIVNIEEFKTVDKSILCIDKEGFKVQASISNLKKGRKPSPYQYNPHAVENIQHYCKKYRPDYELLSKDYVDIKTEYEWIYKGELLPETINKVFRLTADSFINGGTEHPYINKSKGEKKIQDFLNKEKIVYQPQFKTKECKDKKELPFDFAIWSSEKDKIILVEYDGQQHFEPIDFFGGQETFELTKIHDKIKTDYCKKNGIPLLRIKYTEFDRIEEILDKGLVRIEKTMV